MINVPEHFRPHIKVTYPENNNLIFEEWFYQKYDASKETDREYLPIFWTSYYVNNAYGTRNMGDLQAFIDSLDRSKKYFTVLQYDDGILNDISGLDIVVFGSGGGRIDVAIPLLTMPHPYKFEVKKDILVSFAGSMTHPIREEMLNYIDGRAVIRKDRISTEEYCKLMARSKFALCPRGYGKSSFRIHEALQYGSIPVYISDEFITPVGFNGIFVDKKTLPHMMQLLDGLSNVNYESSIKKTLEHTYSFEGTQKYIYGVLRGVHN